MNKQDIINICLAVLALCNAVLIWQLRKSICDLRTSVYIWKRAQLREIANPSESEKKLLEAIEAYLRVIM